MGSAYSQQILKKLQESWNAFFGALKSQHSTHKVGLAGYFKNRRTTQTRPSFAICRNDCYRLDKKFLSILCPKDLKQKYAIKRRLQIKYNVVLKYAGK
ncbi:MAG: hypothetical protein ACFFD2_24835 [Promethearchaeota archaeon]